MAPRPTRLLISRRIPVCSLYRWFAFSSLTFVGIWSFHILDQSLSLDRVIIQSSPSRYIPPPNEIGLPGFHNRDPKFGMPPVTMTNNNNRNNPKIQSHTTTGSVDQSPASFLQQHVASWWDSTGSQTLSTPVPEQRTKTRVAHPIFVEKLKQSQRALEASTLSSSSSTTTTLSLLDQQPQYHWKPAPSNVSFGDFFLPPPFFPPKDTTVVFLVLSSYRNYLRRQSIRETWWNGTVYFVVGQPNCTLSTTVDCHADDQDHYEILQKEQRLYHDLLEIPMLESYRRLPEKVIQAYHWTLQYIPSVAWIVKVDDDTFVRPSSLQRFVQKYNPNIPLWIGKMIPHSPVARSGKWADHEYQPDFYPYWAIGSAGHIVSRSIAQFVVQNSATLHRYQGEDVSLGIWLNQWQQQTVTYIQAERMITNDGIQVCGIPRFMMIGHDLTLDEMYECHLRFQNITDFQENTWFDQPAGFEERVRLEESTGRARLRNFRTPPGDDDTGNGGLPEMGGSKPNNDAAQLGLTGNSISQRRAIGYSFPGSLRDHLAKSP